ncbi:CD3073 family putative ECF transporter S component [Listeria costaricensis]|uniref:CD3073 family putative ECF transporter S component n=1 Tax=Listeria costaricensis TaxID=2026604 RepID=UPI000C068C35|nr:CD3073 family putative ECF transporter S component [Listeria costaricensis]
MKEFNARIIAFCAIGVVLNVVVGSFVSILHIPLLFLDTIGTIFIAASFGIFYGAMTGILTNLLMCLTTGITSLPFALVNVAVAIVVGLIAKKGFTLSRALIAGLILAIVCPLIGTIIRITFFGGATGSGADVIIFILRASGQELFTSTFIATIMANLVDKVVSCLIVYFLMKQVAIKKMIGRTV